MKDYLKIVNHYENCLDQHGDTFKGMDWPNDEQAVLRYQVMLDIIRESGDCSLLDFGCGTALMLGFMKKHQQYAGIDYAGLDISAKSIALATEKYQDTPFYCLDILDNDSDIPNFDYIIMNGVFTEKREMEFEQMWDYFKTMISHIYPLANKGVSFNVMSKAVDWERWDLFHLSTDLLIDFLTKEVTRDFIIRNDYGLYEYSVYLYK